MKFKCLLKNQNVNRSDFVDLFNIQVSEDRLHPNFIHLSRDKDLIKVINSWKIGFEDRDNKFVKEFQTTFNTAFWELYLHACFRNMGFKIEYSYSSPDFVIETRKNNMPIIIEAVSTRHAEGDRPEHDRINAIESLLENSNFDHESLHGDIIQIATERIANSIMTKVNKYQKQYSKLNHVKGKPFILAIGAFEQNFFYNQGTGAIEKVLYGLDKAEYRGNTPYFEYVDHIIKRKNGKKIPIGLFNNAELSCISGILFSSVTSIGKVRALSQRKHDHIFINTYTYNDYGQNGIFNTHPHKKYNERLLDGMLLYLNPYADIPLDPKEFDNSNIAKIYNNDKREIKHGFLFSRTVTNVQARD